MIHKNLCKKEECVTIERINAVDNEEQVEKNCTRN